MLTLRMLRGMPRERVDESLRFGRKRIRGGGTIRSGRSRRSRGRTGASRVEGTPGMPHVRAGIAFGARARRPDRLEGAKQLARGVRFGEGPIRKARPRRALDPREELHPREAVEPEVASEVGVEVRANPILPRAAQLGRDLGDQGDERLRIESGRGSSTATSLRGAGHRRLRTGAGAACRNTLPGCRSRGGFRGDAPVGGGVPVACGGPLGAAEPLLTALGCRCPGARHPGIRLVPAAGRSGTRAQFGPIGHLHRTQPVQAPCRSRPAASSTAATMD